MKLNSLLIGAVGCLFMTSIACSSEIEPIETNVQNNTLSRSVSQYAVEGTYGKYIYLPGGVVSDYNTSFNFRTANLNSSSSYFCWERSKQSENFIVFWESGFGSDPSTCTATIDNVSMNVDIDDMLEKMEAWYDVYADNMGFLGTNSNLDTYKIEIYLFYTSSWIANGGGVDDMIGAFWIAPSACHPVGQTVAHELGHSFQYQTYCDNPSSGCGYRHAVGTGNAFWEVCANYMAWKNLSYYPTWGCEIPYYQANAHRGFCHEWLRYQNFFLINYWESIHGDNILGRIWRESVTGEDAMQTYKRITSTSQSTMNDQVWQSAAREVTWDFDNASYMRSMLDAASSYDRQTWFTNKTDLIYNSADGYYRPSHDPATSDPGTTYNRAFAPQSYGVNIISLTVPTTGTQVSVDFQGLSSYNGGNYRFASDLGWRWGLVARTGTGGWTPVYGTMNSTNSGTTTMTIPSGTTHLYLVVTAAPTQHSQKLWDSDVSNDYEYPYRFKLTNTSLLSGTYTLTNEYVTGITGMENTDDDDNNETLGVFPPVVDYTLNYTVSRATDYTSTQWSISNYATNIASELGVSDLASAISAGTVQFAAFDSSGNITTTYTANSGYWFGNNGAVVSWGSNAYIALEPANGSYITGNLFQYHDTNVVTGTTYPAYIVYYKSNNNFVTVKVNVTIQ
ncbi:MAG: DUF4859 domain-containing protein [Bacteroidales bacterium]|nr:DUF4859 domain-containing protein [Bacteroidales bacterium]